jgi:RHS repeat-associated protein
LTSDYVRSVQYLNGTAQFAATSEGRVYNNTGIYRYDYFMKDQVGNIRLTYTANGTGVTVLQRDEYYPFGNTFDSYLGSGGANTYKFNGMEFQENGVNTFDFHARMYDPQIGRTFQPDPHADSYAAKSLFSFLANNPVMYTDPTGMMENPDVYGSTEVQTYDPPVPDVSWNAWFLRSSFNYRGGNGFLAAFRGEGIGNRRSKQAFTTINQMFTLVERYKDWYGEVSGDYKGTTPNGSI